MCQIIKYRPQVAALLEVMMWANGGDSTPQGERFASQSNGVYGDCYRAIVRLLADETGLPADLIADEDWNLGGNYSWIDDVEAACNRVDASMAPFRLSV